MNAPLLAQESVSRVEYLRSLENRFSEPGPDTGLQILSLVVIFIAAILLVALLNRIQKRKVDPNVEKPLRLFLKAMKCLKLSWRDRWRLWRLSSALRLEHPTALLISPRYYDAAIQDFGRKSSLFGARPSAERALTELRQRIFTESPDSPASPSS